MSKTLEVDRIRCDGHGLCAELLPELISLDDWGYPIIKKSAVPDQLSEIARRAVDDCPVLALRLAAPRSQPVAEQLAPGFGPLLEAVGKLRERWTKVGD